VEERKGCGVAAMQAAQMNTTEERMGCGFAAMYAAHEITQVPKDFRVLIPCQKKHL